MSFNKTYQRLSSEQTPLERSERPNGEPPTTSQTGTALPVAQAVNDTKESGRDCANPTEPCRASAPSMNEVYMGEPVLPVTYRGALPVGNPAMVVVRVPPSADILPSATVGNQRTVMFLPVNLEWGREPQSTTCPHCLHTGVTVTETDPCSAMPVLCAFFCCICGMWPCSIFPFCFPEIRDTVHRCAHCNEVVGKQRQCK
ncbi:unnamed protein product [Discosporangium mesarthrocarpum]